MTRYVLGFLIDPHNHFVILAEKSKGWQAGMLNGIGGKVEESDVFLHRAMVRECEEETGLKTEMEDWLLFHTEKHASGTELYCFVNDKDRLLPPLSLKSLVDEPLHCIPFTGWGVPIRQIVRARDLVPNLHYLIPMAYVYQWSTDGFLRYREG